MAGTKHKLVTRCARRATRVAGHLGGAWKASAHRAYRRMVRMTDHRAEDPNYEPTRRTRISGWDVA
jgi:hypothetical protein